MIDRILLKLKVEEHNVEHTETAVFKQINDNIIGKISKWRLQLRTR